MMLDQELKRRTMRRVYAVWFWRSVAPLLGVELILLLGVAVGVLTQISVRSILINALAASADALAFAKFFVSNFFVKSIQSRLLAVVWTVLLIVFTRDVLRTVRRLRGDGRDVFSLAFAGNRGAQRPVL